VCLLEEIKFHDELNETVGREELSRSLRTEGEESTPLHDERIIAVCGPHPNYALSHTNEISQMEYSHFETTSQRRLSHYVERFTVEKCPMRYESIGRHPRHGDTASTKRQGT